MPLHLRSNSFYVEPVLLEPEPALNFVGVEMKVGGFKLSAQYIVHGFSDIRFDPNCNLVFPMDYAGNTGPAGPQAVKQ